MTEPPCEWEYSPGKDGGPPDDSGTWESVPDRNNQPRAVPLWARPLRRNIAARPPQARASVITPEDFEIWRGNPVTEFVLACVKQIGEGAKAEWLKASWDGGALDPAFLAGLKAKEQIAKDMAELSYEDIKQWQQDRT